MNSVQQHFMRSIGAGILAGAMIAPAMAASNVPAAEPVAKAQGSEKTCVSIYSVRAKQDKDAAYIARLFNMAGVSLDQPKIGNGTFFVCLDPQLFYTEMRDGSYGFDSDVLKISTGNHLDDVARAIIVVHEGRHRTQHVLGIDHARAMNVLESERVMIGLLEEADARLEEVLLADRERSKGNMDFVNKVRQRIVGQRIMKAFDDSLRLTGGDRKQAMRAVIYEFISHPDSRNTYIDIYMQSIGVDQRERFAFNPQKPRATMLDNTTLKKFGERAGESNYMDDSLMWAIRQCFSQDKYESAVALTRRHAGAVTLRARP